MSNVIIEQILREMMDEFKQISLELKSVETTITGLSEKLDGFQQRQEDFNTRLNDIEWRISQHQVVVPPPDTAPFEKSLTDGIGKMNRLLTETKGQICDLVMQGSNHVNNLVTAAHKNIAAIVEAQPKQVLKKSIFQFYPESDRSGNYRYLVNWVFGAFILIPAILCLFAWGMACLRR